MCSLQIHLCVCVCTSNRTDSKLQFSVHPPTLWLWRILPLSFLPSLTSTFSSYNIHVTLSGTLGSFIFTFMSNSALFLSLPLSLLHLFFTCSLLFHLPSSPLLIFLFLQEPQTTVIHNPVDGTKVYVIPQSRPVLSPPLSFSSSSLSSPLLWYFFSCCICASATWLCALVYVCN